MDIMTMLSVFLMLCGISQAKDLNPKINLQGYNATVYIDGLRTDGDTTLEINFSGYISNLHFTNVMLCRPRNGQIENISINSNYTGRIQSIVLDNGHFSFLLLNVTFKDSGNYTVKEQSFDKGTACVLAARRILVAELGEPITLSFITNEETFSSIKIDDPITRRTVLFYNVAERDCNYTDIITLKQLQLQCWVSKKEFSFAIPEISWLHKGGYFAWNDKGYLLDSIFVDIEVKAPKVDSEDFFTSKRHMLYIILGMGAILAAAFLACLGYQIRSCLQVRASISNTSTYCSNDDGEKILQEGHSLGHYCAIVSNERGELITVIETDLGQRSEPSLIGENLVSANIELEHSLGPESICVNVELHNVPDPIQSRPGELNNYLQLI